MGDGLDLVKATAVVLSLGMDWRIKGHLLGLFQVECSTVRVLIDCASFSRRPWLWAGISGLVHQGGFLQRLDQLHHRHEPPV